MGWRVRKINKKMRDLLHGSPSEEEENKMNWLEESPALAKKSKV